MTGGDFARAGADPPSPTGVALPVQITLLIPPWARHALGESETRGSSKGRAGKSASASEGWRAVDGADARATSPQNTTLSGINGWKRFWFTRAASTAVRM